jgi:predicted DNA-binding transcriptional regulator AlpA
MNDGKFEMLTKEDIATILKISLRTVENWVADGLLPPPATIGSIRRWHSGEFYAFMERTYFPRNSTQPMSAGAASRDALETDGVAETPVPVEKTVAANRGAARRSKQSQQPAVNRMASRSATDLAYLNA